MPRGGTIATQRRPLVGRRYWLDRFTLNAWTAFRQGGDASSFPGSEWRTVKHIRAGDYLLCYLPDAHRWVGVLEVTGDPYLDRVSSTRRIETLAHVPVTAVTTVSPETGVPFALLKHRRPRTPAGAGTWAALISKSPTLCEPAFGESVSAAVRDAERHPVTRPLATMGVVRAGHIAETSLESAGDQEEPPTVTESHTLHTEIQWLLAKLGDDMGLHVWVARNDRHRDFKGRRFTGLSRLVDDLPVHFDDATTRTVELIDVLWLQGKAIISAFEIESTTSIYTGLLRMADLVAMQPNLKIPLFLVAGEERRAKVIGEVNRPTFSRLDPPLNQICRFISFETLRTHLGMIERFARHMNPSFLAEVSEACREASPESDTAATLARASP